MSGRNPVDKDGGAVWWSVAAVILVVAAFAAVKYATNHASTAPGTPVITATSPDSPFARSAGDRLDSPTPAPTPMRSPQMLLGNPSDASADPASRDNYLMVKSGFALSYNETKGTANWVSWRLRSEDCGSAPRKAGFDPDELLPAGFYRVVHKDYSGSGFDRGHMCPHSDRDATQESADGTFIMTNIIPQAPNVNQKAWATLETYCRSLVKARGVERTLYIISGPWGRGGVGSKGPRETIANGRVVVPAECWKVIVIDEDNVKSSTEITAASRVIAVRMPNDETKVDLDWAGFRVRPTEIEKETGLRFFSACRPEVAEQLRNKLDQVSIPAAAAPKYLRGKK